MNIIQWLGDLILSQWIWSITFAFSHYTFSFFIMLIILSLFTKDRFFSSFFITTASLLCAFGIFFFIATVGLDYLCSWQYCPVFNAPLSLQKADVMRENLILAGFITVFQTLFFTVFSFLTWYRAFPYICVALLSNCIAALCCYGYILVTMEKLLHYPTNI
jgi:hypothetical protein